MSTSNNKSLLSDIAIMRPILIISIVIGHGYAMFVNSGSTSWPLPSNYDTVSGYSWINPTFISFALQAFVFVSGYLFAYKKPINKFDFILKKVKRILLPLLIFSTLYVLILHPQHFNDISVAYEIANGAGHLWFLPMLFWCYLLGTIFCDYFGKYTLSKGLLLISLSVGAYVLSALVGDYFRFLSGIQYLVYFILGMWIYTYRTSIISLLKSPKTPYFIGGGWVTIGILCGFKIKLIDLAVIPDDTMIKAFILLARYANRILLGILGSVTLWATINMIVKDKNINIRGDIWFGLYIYHQIIMMWLYYHTSLPTYTTNIWLPWIVLGLTLLSSYLLVVCTLKLRVGRWLIG